jgi:hypothetical protein
MSAISGSNLKRKPRSKKLSEHKEQQDHKLDKTETNQDKTIPVKKSVKPPTVNTITQLNHVPFPEKQIIFSIDPGRVNFACRLEERTIDASGKVSIKGMLFVKKRFEELFDISKFFEENYNLLSQTTICIVEKQMSINYTMIRVSQHVETYFLTRFPQCAVFEISSKLKVGKEDTIETAKEILKKGEDRFSSEIMDRLMNPEKIKGQRKPKKEKMDDLCDTVCQIEAFVNEMKRLEFKVPQGYILKTKGKKKSSKNKGEIAS